MCRVGNQTVLKGCRDAIIKALGKPNPSNQEYKAILKQNSGCMTK